MSSEVGSDSGREAMSWGRGQEEESSSGRIVEGIDDDGVLSPAPLTSVPPMSRSPQQPRVSGGVGGFFPSKVNEKQLADWHRIYMVPGEIEFFVPGLNDRADDPPLGCMALNQAVLAAGLCFPFPRIVRKFLRDWGVAPTQLCPNGWRILLGFLILWDQLGFPRPSVREFNSLYSFKSDGKRSGWWYASVKPKTGGYTSHKPTPEFIERAQKARAIDESFRSSSALITEENLAAARLSSATSSNSRPRKFGKFRFTLTYLYTYAVLTSSLAGQSGKEMKDISVILKKKGQAGKGKRKAPSEGQPPAVRPWTEEDGAPTNVPSPARSVEEITSFPTRGEPSSSPVCRPPPPSSQIPPKPSSRIPLTYLGSTSERDEEYLKLRGSIPKPLRDFFRSNSPTQGDIVELPSSARRAISVLGKSWTPDQQKYLDSMETVKSIVAASVNTSRAAIQLTSAAEKMGRMKKEDELKALAVELEATNKSRADLEHDLEGERKSNAELKAALEKSADKDEAVAEFRSSNAYLVEQEMVYFLTMEELIETTMEKRPD
ncbi:Uncharacterized protein Adt_26562 [Abeliophyllum distichum]|uniref:Uncharacterized protein n=1 Tax=Abeliophyllum distichum TaxID=126358 RepID=A0ABD1RSC7_9LAMI